MPEWLCTLSRLPQHIQFHSKIEYSGGSEIQCPLPASLAQHSTMAQSIIAPLTIRGQSVLDYLMEGGSWFEADEVVWRFQLETAQTDSERDEALVGLGLKSSGIYEKVLAAAALEAEVDPEPESEPEAAAPVPIVAHWQDRRQKSQRQPQSQDYRLNPGQSQRQRPQRPFHSDQRGWQHSGSLKTPVAQKPALVAPKAVAVKTKSNFAVLADSDSE